MPVIHPASPRERAAEGLQIIRSLDPKLVAMADRLWRFPEVSVESPGRIRAGGDFDSKLDRDPVIVPESPVERSGAVLHRLFRPLPGVDAVPPMTDLAAALQASAVEVGGETPAERNFLKQWERQHA